MGIWGDWSIDYRKRRSSIRLSVEERNLLECKLKVVRTTYWRQRCQHLAAMACCVTVLLVGAALMLGVEPEVAMFGSPAPPFTLHIRQRQPMPPNMFEGDKVIISEVYTPPVRTRTLPIPIRTSHRGLVGALFIWLGRVA
jgi:hypothetical protein